MKILIIRHGDPDYEHDALTEKGEREAALLAKRMVKTDVTDYFVSPQGRAQATIAPTLKATGRQAETLDWLHEFRGVVLDPHSGQRRIAWNFMPQYWTLSGDIMDKNAWMRDPLIRTGNSEEIYHITTQGLDALLARYGLAREGMIYRCERSTKDTVALFCHCGIGLVMIAYLLGFSPIHLLNAALLPTSSVTTLIGEERREHEVFFRLYQMGDTSHLYAGGEPNSMSGMFGEVYTSSL